MGEELTMPLHTKLFATEDVMQKIFQLRRTQTHQTFCGFLIWNRRIKLWINPDQVKWVLLSYHGAICKTRSANA